MEVNKAIAKFRTVRDLLALDQRSPLEMLIMWLVIAAVTKCSAGNPWNSNDNRIFEEIQNLTGVIASSYFSEARCIGVVTERPGVHLRTSQLPIFYITLNSSGIKLDNLLLTVTDAGCLAFVIQVDDMKLMVEILSYLARSPTSLYRANRRFLYLPQHAANGEDSWKEVMNNVFSSTPMKWMPDLLVVHLHNVMKQVNNSNRTYAARQELVARYPQGTTFLLEIYTHKFVGQNPSEMILVDIWIPGYRFLYGANLFYDKLRNLMGKEMKAMCIPYAPYSEVILNSEPPLFDGLEAQALFEFGKKYNITWKMQYDIEYWWGEIWENGSGNGIYGSTSDDRVDFGYSAIFMLFREFFYFDYSMPIHQGGLTALAPKPKRLPGWLIPVQPFNSSLWYAVGISLVIVTFVFYIFSRVSQATLGGNIASQYSTLTECGFRALGLLVLQVPEDERDYSTPRYAPLRHLVSWCILFFLVVTSAYGGGLASILTIPRFQPPIETAKDLADSGIYWCALAEAYIFSLQGSTDPVMQTIKQNFVVRSEKELVELAFDDNYALLLERLQGGHFTDMKYIFEEMIDSRHLMRDDVISEHSVFVFRKGSPYKEKFNALINKLRQSGIPLYWESITVLKFLSQRLQISIAESRAPPEVDQRKLTLSHVAGPFYLLALGLLVSLVILILELIKFHCIEERNGGRF